MHKEVTGEIELYPNLDVIILALVATITEGLGASSQDRQPWVQILS